MDQWLAALMNLQQAFDLRGGIQLLSHLHGVIDEGSSISWSCILQAAASGLGTICFAVSAASRVTSESLGVMPMPWPRHPVAISRS